MGKAIIINGLVVTNPLTTVTILTPESILDAYLNANGTITEQERLALETFVQGLYENGLWTKMRYFYPMLGSTVSDMILDAVSPSTEDLFTNFPTTDFSVVDRVLVTSTASATNGNANLISRFRNTDWHNFGVVSSTKHANSNSTNALRFSGQNGYYTFTFMPLSGTFTERNPQLNVGSLDGTSASYLPTAAVTDLRTYLDRIIFAQTQGSSAEIYKDKELYVSGTSYVENINAINNYTVLTGSSASYNFLAITDNMTQAQYSTFYDLLLAFLKAVGKHS